MIENECGVIAIPPGETIREMIKDRKLNQIEFAARMELSRKHVSNLINGKVELSYDVAQRLEKVLGPEAGFWNRLELQYREDLEKVRTGKNRNGIISAITAANFFIQKTNASELGDMMTNLRLQKLLFFAQGWYMALFDSPLFKESIAAWSYGPVVPDVYYRLKTCGRNPIAETFGEFHTTALPERAGRFLTAILTAYEGVSTSELVRRTHEMPLWQEHVKNKGVIPLHELRECFSKAAPIPAPLEGIL